LLVINVGTVTLNSVVLTDGSVTSEGVSCESGIPDSLLPGEGFECQATYTIVQDDVDRGFVVSNATVAAIDPSKAKTNKTSEVSTDLVRRPAISLDTMGFWANAGNGSAGFADAGD
ncbi:unnamed protein product, partial [Ectocarpus sp. 12 AP-2014]